MRRLSLPMVALFAPPTFHAGGPRMPTPQCGGGAGKDGERPAKIEQRRKNGNIGLGG
ncbi:hypothetical protein HPP92_015918 [Vanilla planifolia]|uniref:Uncharacterized protein n=1 Tax=Vanilla planifolia TaxID=51239 RepID=A0A835QP99_VANPL|nr:hypothetical protein HPP92_015918 [Vanilla planifolia]